MGSSQSKNIPNSSKSSRALRVNTIMGPTNSLLKKRTQSRVRNVIGPNIIGNSYAMRLGNIQAGNNTVEPVMAVVNNRNTRPRSSSISSISSTASNSIVLNTEKLK